MKRSYKIAVILLLIALVFSIATFVIMNYFPQVIGYNSPQDSGSRGEGGNLRIVVEPPAQPSP